MDHKRNQHQSIDGFDLRRRTPQSGTAQPLASDNMHVPERFLHDGTLPRPVAKQSQQVQLQRQPEPMQRAMLDPTAKAPEPQKKYDPTTEGLRRADIDASLNSIDEPEGPKKPRRRNGGGGRGWRPSKKFFKRLAIILLVLIVLTGAYVGIKAFVASSKVFKGNIFDLLGKGQQLKTDQYGRSNILVFGTSEDDPDHKDAGANLTDSLMIVSIDQKNKNAAMISIPRDIWVDYNKSCMPGNEGKINALYSCYSDDGKNEADGANALKQNIGENFGMDIQYYAHVNYTVVKQVVDAVGGVEVTIESSDPRGILDRNFDWKCRNQCYYVKYANGPTGVMDGEHALYLARARGDDNGQATYGLGGGNFDREKNQQKILTALKGKATNAGTLSNPVAVTGMIDALGDNVRTNFTGPEIKTLIGLGKDIPTDKIKSISLVEPGNPVVNTGSYMGQSIVKPVAGVDDFSEIQAFVRGKLNALNGQEQGDIEVLNGSTSMGVAGAKAKELKAEGISVTSVGDTDANNYPAIAWYDLSGGKLSKTSAKIKGVLGVEAAGTTLPTGVQSSADFVIIIGDGVN